MLRFFLFLGILTSALSAEDRWVYMHSDGFEVFTDATAKLGRTTLVRLEQFRYALGKILGKTDLVIKPPAQVYVFKTAKEAAQYSAGGPIQTGREHVSIIMTTDGPSEDFQRRLAKLLIESNTDRMAEDLERGLIALFSTLEVTGIRITVGKPVASAERDTDWARMHMLAVDQQYYGKLPILFYNLQKGAEDDPAYRNAFGKSKAEIEAEVERYKAAGNFSTTSLSSRPMSAEHDFPDKPVEPDLMQDKLAGVLREQEFLAKYQGLLAKARANLSDTAALNEAIQLEPKQAEPRFLLAQREPDAKKRIDLLKAAIELDRRQAAYWQALAESYATLHDYKETAKAWRSAEQASATPAERDKMHKAWLDVERQRLDFEDSEKKRIAAENERELRKLKDAEIANLRALEARVNQGGSIPKDAKVESWWNGPSPSGKAVGLLKQVDCLGKQARLLIQTDDGKLTKLLVRDPSKIAIVGEKQQALGCGRQKPRKISVEYFPKPDPKLATTGDVATIEFPE
jgi:tetratricopeptide (TPR) repeat protein